MRRAGVVVIVLLTSLATVPASPAEGQDDWVVPAGETRRLDTATTVETQGNIIVHGTLIAAHALTLRADVDVLVTGTIQGENGPLNIRSDRSIVVPGVIRGGQAPLSIHAADDVRILGSILMPSAPSASTSEGFAAAAALQGADGAAVQISGTNVVISGLVKGGNGGPGGDDRAIGTTVAGSGGAGGDASITSVLSLTISNTGVVAAGSGGPGGRAIGANAKGGTGGASGDVSLTAGTALDIDGVLVGGRGGNGGEAIAVNTTNPLAEGGRGGDATAIKLTRGTTATHLSQGEWNLLWNSNGLLVTNYTMRSAVAAAPPSALEEGLVMARHVVVAHGNQTLVPASFDPFSVIEGCEGLLQSPGPHHVAYSAMGGAGGRACTRGLAGGDGPTGPDGHDSTGALDACTDGGPGGDGGDGLTGGSAIGGGGGSVDFGIGGQGGAAQTVGGPGGQGGPGGLGGDGYGAQDGCTGGNGGAGGSGGPGGHALGGDGGTATCGYAGNAGGAVSTGGKNRTGAAGGAGGSGGTLGDPGSPGLGGSAGNIGVWGFVESGTRAVPASFGNCLQVTTEIGNSTALFTAQQLAGSQGIAVTTGYAQALKTLSGNMTRNSVVNGHDVFSKSSLWGPEIAGLGEVAFSGFEYQNLTWGNRSAEDIPAWLNGTSSYALADPLDYAQWATFTVRSSAWSEPQFSWRGITLANWWTWEKICTEEAVEFVFLDLLQLQLDAGGDGGGFAYDCGESAVNWARRLPLTNLWGLSEVYDEGDATISWNRVFLDQGWSGYGCGDPRFIWYSYHDEPETVYYRDEDLNKVDGDPYPCLTQWHLRAYAAPDTSLIFGQAHWEDSHSPGYTHRVHDVDGSQAKVDDAFESSTYGEAWSTLGGFSAPDTARPDLTKSDHSLVPSDGSASAWYYDV